MISSCAISSNLALLWHEFTNLYVQDLVAAFAGGNNTTHIALTLLYRQIGSST